MGCQIPVDDRRSLLVEEVQPIGHIQENSILHMTRHRWVLFKSLRQRAGHELHDESWSLTCWAKMDPNELDNVGVMELAVLEALFRKSCYSRCLLKLNFHMFFIRYFSEKLFYITRLEKYFMQLFSSTPVEANSKHHDSTATVITSGSLVEHCFTLLV